MAVSSSGSGTVIDRQWFAGEGVFAISLAAMFFAAALLTLLWLRGPGSRPHDPPIAHDVVRQFALTLALFGGFWLIRAFAGPGGALVVYAVAIVVSLIRLRRARARRTQ